MSNEERILIIGDTHCPAMHPRYRAFLRRVKSELGPTRIVHIGDLLDFREISRFQQAPNRDAFRAELRRARRQIEALVEEFSQVDWVLGNHEERYFSAAKRSGLTPECLQPLSVLTGVPWQTHRSGRLVIRGIEFHHGDRVRSSACPAANLALTRGRHVVMGHHHGHAGAAWVSVAGRRYFGLSVGCGIDRQNEAFDYAFVGSPAILGCGWVVADDRDVRVAAFIPM